MSRKKGKRIRQETRTEKIPIRFSPTERAAVEQVAALEHDYPSSYLRRLIMRQIDSINAGQSQKTQPREVLQTA